MTVVIDVVLEEPWWWLSFCDPKRPEGAQLLGVTIVEGKTFLGAVMRAHALGCNPGGEVEGRQIPFAVLLKLDNYRDRLLSPEESRCLVAQLDGGTL